MDPRIGTALIVLVGVPAVLIGYIYGTELLLRTLPERLKPKVRPWLWLLPALAFLFVFLIYPTIGTIIRSFRDKLDESFVGFANYQQFASSDVTLTALRNNILWVIFLTLFCVGVGMLIAILVDRVRYESFAKGVIFLPLAISAVAAGVIWKFMFDYQPPGQPQTGTMNAFIGLLGVAPVPWLQNDTLALNTFALIGVMAWMWTGFAMVIISASLKSISAELLEAARVDGANEWQVFRGIVFPLLLPTIAVVSTTMIITALKAFDVVYTMTGGNFNTDVVANLMYKQISFGDFGFASAIAVVLLLAIIPIMLVNVRRFQAQEAIR
ncbi:MAG: sugar ABC transporter permease [Chloroflexi bacterium]|nr:MAG: sugar ABC transporter permease [Chloroflexota bacterium]